MITTALPPIYLTPIKAKEERPLFSPSIKSSPVTPREPQAYHDDQALLERVALKVVKKLKIKPILSVCVTDSAKKEGRRLAEKSNADYISKCAKQIQLHPDDPPPDLEIEPGVAVQVIDRENVVVHDQKRSRTRSWGVHTQETPKGTRKSWYPKSGDGIVVVKRGSEVSPKDLVPIIQEYRASPEGAPKESVKRKFTQLISK